MPPPGAPIVIVRANAVTSLPAAAEQRRIVAQLDALLLGVEAIVLSTASLAVFLLLA